MKHRARLLAPVLALGLIAQAHSAQGFTPERAAIFVQAMRTNACAMSADEAPVLLPPLGLAPDEVQQFVDILFTVGAVSLSPDLSVLTLSEALCAADAQASLDMIRAAYDAPLGAMRPWVPDFTPEQGAALIGAVRGNGCALSDAEAGLVLPPVGIDPTLSRDVVAVMLDLGLASVDDASGVLHLSDALCAADPAQDGATIDAARAAFVAAQDAETAPTGDAPAPAEEGE